MPVPPRPPAAAPPRPRLQPRGGDAPDPRSPDGEDDWPVDQGRPLGLRLLALLGALSFLMLGLSVVAPLLQPRPQPPRPAPASGGATA